MTQRFIAPTASNNNRCGLFYCDRRRNRYCCYYCPTKTICHNPCINDPDKCGKHFLAEEPDPAPKERGPVTRKRYHIETPEQLRELASFTKEGSAEQIASTWSAKRRKAGKTPWDNDIYAVFIGGKNRKACIARKDANGNQTVFVWLKYNYALKWCEQNLKLESEEQI